MRVLKSIHPLSLPLRAFLKTEEGTIHDARVIAIGVFDDGNGGLPDAVPLTLDPKGVWVDVRTLTGFTGFDTMTKHAGIAADYLEMAKERFPASQPVPVGARQVDAVPSFPRSYGNSGATCGTCGLRPVMTNDRYSCRECCTEIRVSAVHDGVTYEAALLPASTVVSFTRDGKHAGGTRWEEGDFYALREGDIDRDLDVRRAVKTLLGKQLWAHVELIAPPMNKPRRSRRL